MGAVLLWERAEYSTVGRSPPEVVIHNLMDMKLCPYLKVARPPDQENFIFARR